MYDTMLTNLHILSDVLTASFIVVALASLYACVKLLVAAMPVTKPRFASAVSE